MVQERNLRNGGIPGGKVDWQGSVWGIERGKGRAGWVVGGQNKA